jgi:hypothetical protein
MCYMMDYKEYFNSLLATQTLESVTDDNALEIIGGLVDLSLDLQRNDGIDTALKLAEEFLDRSLTREMRALTHYFLANAWSNRQKLQRVDFTKAWEWEQEELEKEIIHIRLAVKYGCHYMVGAPEILPAQRQCEVWTNYGNLMSLVGRVAEGIEYRDKALNIDPSFSMALGTRGQGLLVYSRYLSDGGHRGVFIKQAYSLLKKALEGDLHIDARKAFESDVKRIENAFQREFLTSYVDMSSFSLGDSKSEIEYRQWCLNNRLFLNPLNDLGPYSIGARDIISMPSIVVDINEGPYYIGFFNQMKQEFVSARYLFFDGINSSELHFSDKDVLLYNTLDYPSYGLAVEKVRIAYRMVYSLFDKLAFFLRKYLDLDISERNISFRKIWYVKTGRRDLLREDFYHKENLPLRGLFWLSKDFYEDYEKKDAFRDSIEPEAKDLREIRNHLEHKYLKLHLPEWSRPDEGEFCSIGLIDSLAHSLYRSDFEVKTLKLLKLARSALIYLTLAVQCEELKRRAEKCPDSMVVSLPSYVFDDSWKC